MSKNRIHLRPASRAMALEPRILFDGAGAIAATDVYTHDLAHAYNDRSQDAPAATPAATRPATDRPADLDPGRAPSSGTGLTLLVVDARVADYQQLLTDLPANVIVRVVGENESGLAAVSQALQAQQGSHGVASIQIISHGSPGSFSLGSDAINADTLSAQSQALQSWAGALTADADILLYGCDVGQGAQGQALITQLASLTGADIAASIDPTGAAAKGGNWVLESSTGSIEAGLALSAAGRGGYDGLLAAPTITDPAALPREINEDGGTLSFGNLTITGTGTGTVTVTATLTENNSAPGATATDGKLTLTTTTGVTVISGDGTGTISFQGNATDVQAALNALAYKPTDNFNGDAKIVVALSNTDGSASKDIKLQVIPVNDAPNLTPPVNANAPAAAVADEQGANMVVDLTPAHFGINTGNYVPFDPDLIPALSTVTAQTTEQITFELITEPTDGRLSKSGAPLLAGSLFTLKDLINGSIKYTHQDVEARESLSLGSESDVFTVTVRDGAGGISTANVPIKINPINDAPTITGGIAGGVIAYEGRNGVPLQVTVTDPDQVATTLDFTFTGLNLQGGSLYLDNGGGSKTNITDGYVFTGTQADLNSRLKADVSEAEPIAPMTFKVSVTDDGGGAGAGSALTSTADITINQRENNDHPVLVINAGSTAGSPVLVNTLGDTNDDLGTLTLTTQMLNVTDLDSPAETTTFTLSSDITNTSGGGTAYLVFNNGSGNNYLPNGASFTLADISAGRVKLALGSGTGINDFKFDFIVRDGELTAFSTVKQTENSPAIEGGTRNAADTAYLTHSFNFQFDTATGIGSNTLGPANSVPSVGLIQGISAAGLSEGGAAVRLWGGADVGVNVGGVLQPGIVINDTDNSPSQLTVRLEKLPNGATLLLDGVAVPLFGSFTYQQLLDGKVTYKHNGGEQFLTSNLGFAFSVSDGAAAVTPTIGGTSGAGNNFSVEATPVNDTPTVSVNNGIVVLEGNSITFNTGTNSKIILSDVDGNGDLGPSGLDNFKSDTGVDELYVTVTKPPNGDLYLNGSLTPVIYASAQILKSDIESGKLKYVHDGSETKVDSFSVTVNDQQSAGNSVGNTINVEIQIAPLNNLPRIDPITDNAGASIPTGTQNTGLRVTEGGSGIIGGSVTGVGGTAFNNISEGAGRSQLTSIDPDNSATQIQYKITTNVTLGKLLLNNKVLGLNSTFTQADLDAGNLKYVHTTGNGTGAGVINDFFNFSVGDGGPGIYPTGKFDIDVVQTNDTPVVKATTTLVNIDKVTPIAISGVSIGDVDFPTPTEESTAPIRVFVRLTDNGTPLVNSGAYTGYTIGSSAALSGATVTGGIGDYLVLTGTIKEVNDYLVGLQFTSTIDPNKTLKLEVIADDRVYSGTLPTSDANGGTTNENKTEGGVDQTIATVVFDPYTTTVDTFNGYNVASKTIDLRISPNDEPATVTVPGAQTVKEDVGFVFSTTNGTQISVTDPEASGFGINTTVKLEVGSGKISVGTQAGVTVSNNSTGTVTLVGKVADINTLLGNGVTYMSATDNNADKNAGVAGDVTLKVSITEGAAAIGQGTDLGGVAGSDTVSQDIPITITAVNDAPVVNLASSTAVPAASSTTAVAVGGFSVTDKDIGDGVIASEEVDFVQVTVRLLDQNGNPLLVGSYADVVIAISGPTESAVAGSEFEIDNTLNGTGAALQLRGTLANVNAALTNLTVKLGTTLSNIDQPYRVEVVADDRVRNLTSGVLVATGVDANGGEENNVGNNSAVAVLTTELDPYAAKPAIFNIATAFRTILPSSSNDVPNISAPGDVIVNEDTRTFVGTGIVVSDTESDNFNLPVRVTLSVGTHGTLSVGGAVTTANGTTIGATGVKVVSGDETGSITLEGTASKIQALLRNVTNGLFYQSGQDDNADHNAAANGDVTVSMSIDEYLSATTFGATAVVVNSNFNITVNPLNDAPVIAGTVVSTPHFIWQDLDASGVPTSTWHWTAGADATDTGVDKASATAVSLLSGVTVTDVDLNTLINSTGANSLGGGSITVKMVGGYVAGDTLAVPGVLPAGASSVAGGTGTDLVITLNATATQAEVAAILNALTFDNDGDPSVGGTRLTRGFSIQLKDGNNNNGTNNAGGPVALDSNLLTGNLNFLLRKPPVAVNDTGSADVTASAPTLTGSVRTNDTDPDHATNLLNVTLVKTGATVLGGDPVSSAPVELTGTHGKLSIAQDGSYTYTLNTDDPIFVALGANATLQDTFSYRITDPDGQSDDATLIITIKETNDGVTVTVPDNRAQTTPNGVITDQVVFESGLPTGSSPNANDLKVDSDFTLVAPDGLNTTVALVVGYKDAGGSNATLTLTKAQVEALATTPKTITTQYGNLALDGYTKIVNGTFKVDYTYTLNNAPNITGTDTTDAFTIVAKDRDGEVDPVPKTLNIKIIDDVPKANNDSNSIVKGNSTVSGNAFANDTVGADGAAAGGPVTAIAGGALSTPLLGNYGTITLRADGTYSYALDNSKPDVVALTGIQTLTETFTYTITDKDGDPSNATITIIIRGPTPNALPVAVNDSVTVDFNTTGTGNLVGNDTPSTDGGNVWTKTTNPGNGTAVVNADGTYTYTPNTGFSGSDSFTYTITDKDGDKSTATVTITVESAAVLPVTPPVEPPVVPPVVPPVIPPVVPPVEPPVVPPVEPPVVPPVVPPVEQPVVPPVVPPVEPPVVPPVVPPVEPPVIPPVVSSVLEPGQITPESQPNVPAPILQPLNPLQRDQVREPSVFFDGAVFNDVPRLSIPLHPIVYVTPEVAASQAERERSDPLFYSNPQAVQHGGVQSSSIGAGLGMDPTVFVQMQVRRAQSYGELVGDIVNGRLPRVSLSSDGRIATPEWFNPDAEQIVPDMPGEAQTPTPPEPQLPTAERVVSPDVVAVEQVDRSLVTLTSSHPAPRAMAAPSFSEQLRHAGARSPVAARAAIAVPFVS